MNRPRLAAVIAAVALLGAALALAGLAGSVDPSDVTVTETSFRILLAALAVALAAAAVLGLAPAARHGRTRRVGQLAALAVVVLVLAALNVGAAVNAHYDYDRTLGDVLGLPPADEGSLAALLRRRTVPDRGAVATLGVPATASGFAARPAVVYVPPAWFARPRPKLPVVVLLHGTPGSPGDWIDGGRAAATADAWAAAHRGVAPILVMPDINGSLDADSECVDGPLGRTETYLAVDLPAAVSRTLLTAPPGRRWAVAGLSEGGSCSLMLALRHPDTFATFGDYAGLAGPRVGDTNADTASTVSGLFGGSAAAFAAHEPSALLGTRSFRGLGGWFEVGDQDAEPLAATQALVPLARAAGVRTCEKIIPGGGHTFDVFSAAFADSLPWMAGRLDLAAPVTPPGCGP